MADFIHLDTTLKTLRLIHAKAAHSALDTRQISVSAYEVVCAQALKNLRAMERDHLTASLRHKIKIDKVGRCWKDGRKLAPTSPDFLKALEKARYSELKHEVVVLQPHVSLSKLPSNLSANSRDARQTRLLYTLLHAVDADVRRMNATFRVIVST